MTTNPALSRVVQAGAVILSYLLTAFAVELGKGTVPIPPDYAWSVPIINAGITGALIFLPRPGSEMLARQVDHYRQEHNLSRDELKVVPKDPRVQASLGHREDP